MAFASQPTKAVGAQPYDLAAAERLPGWRDDLAWPARYADTRRRVMQAVEAAAEHILAAGGGEASAGVDIADLALLAAPRLTGTTSTLVDAAATADAALTNGVRLRGGPPELRRLLGGTDMESDYTPPSRFAPVGNRGALFRQVARTASWTPVWAMPAAMLAPHAVAVSHNSLLRHFARSRRALVRYHLIGIRPEDSMAAGEASAAMLRDFAAELAEVASKAADVGEAVAGPLGPLLRREFQAALLAAAPALHAARRARRVPKRIWTGTLSDPHRRALALEVRRRGGSVTIFDHGGGFATSGWLAAREARVFALADYAVVASERAAGMLRKSLDAASRRRSRRPEVVAADGDPTFSRIRARGPIRARRPRVLYLPSPLLGFRQLVPPMLADVVKLDWQIRLAEALSALPADLVVRPHPEGALPPARHPVTAQAPSSQGPFRKAVDQAERLVFEYPHSTAFWEALCTDRPVVLIDLGTGNLSGMAAAMVAQRCRILAARFDGRNRPVVDPAELAEAVLGGPDRADPTEVRALLAGEAG